MENEQQHEKAIEELMRFFLKNYYKLFMMLDDDGKLVITRGEKNCGEHDIIEETVDRIEPTIEALTLYLSGSDEYEEDLDNLSRKAIWEMLVMLNGGTTIILEDDWMNPYTLILNDEKEGFWHTHNSIDVENVSEKEALKRSRESFVDHVLKIQGLTWA